MVGGSDPHAGRESGLPALLRERTSEGLSLKKFAREPLLGSPFVTTPGVSIVTPKEASVVSAAEMFTRDPPAI